MTLPAAGQLRPGTRVHLVGIGGAGMSALGVILLERGFSVSGSDLRGGRSCAALEAMGAEIAIGHDAANVADADLVVVSAAVPPSNPEVVRANERGVEVWPRPRLLAAIMEGQRALLVSGTHGKTTTTSLVTVALQQAGMDPSFAIGGTLGDSGTSAHAGRGEVFVAEADEAYRSFLTLSPNCAIVTNVELDHHDHYGSLGEVRAAFLEFLSLDRDPQRVAVICRDDPGAASLLADVAGSVRTYGLHDDADVRITGLVLEAGGSRFGIVDPDGDQGAFHLRVPGRHNVLNAAAAITASRWAGAPIEDIRAGIAAFQGAARRFQRLGTAAGVLVVDDYAHHPTEVEATLQAARQVHGTGRIVAVFQPHLYSRTTALGTELGTALAAADLVVVTDVFAAREAPVPGVDGTVVADAAKAAGAEVEFVAATGEVAPRLTELVRPGDLVLTLGAGDITEVGPVLLRLLEGRHG